MRALIRGCSVVVGLSVAAAIGLGYLRPDLFPIEWSLPGTLAYFGQFAVLLRALRGKKNVVNRVSQDEALGGSKFDKSALPDWLQELLAMGIFLVLGVIAGAVSGIVWWFAGGQSIRTIWEALKIGAIAGGGAMLLLFAGP